MNYADWYTDTMDIYRVTATTSAAGLTTNARTLIVSAVPCRIYRTSHKDIYMQQTAANDSSSNMIACDNSVNVQIGDEIIAHRGGGLGQSVADERAFVSDIN